MKDASLAESVRGRSVASAPFGVVVRPVRAEARVPARPVLPEVALELPMRTSLVVRDDLRVATGSDDLDLARFDVA